MNPQENNKFLENVAEHACKYFSEKLPKKGKPCTEKFEWTTMAAIVQCIGQENFKVVSLGTGTKCLGKNELSPLGDVLSDSHAEVVCRRSFLLYLYDQLFLILSNKESIFEMKKSDETLQTFFCLRPSITFHLFISHVPCGDAAIFNSPVNNDSSEINEPPTKKSKNIEDHQKGIDNNNGHRTGAKLNVGDSTYEDVQTVGKCRVKPGKGDPTLSMSCSDKIAKWQIMGLQGSLLGNFIRNPIIFQSIIIGGSVPFEYASMKRALHDRFFNVKDGKLNNILLQSRFKEQSPEIYQSGVNFLNFSPAVYHVPKPAPGSISSYHKYDINNVYAEVSVNGRKQGATKKCFGKTAAQVAICRRNLFQLFFELCNQYEKSFKTSLMPMSSSTTYREAKAFNSVYSETWSSVKNDVMNRWTAKPDNLKDFSL